VKYILKFISFAGLYKKALVLFVFSTLVGVSLETSRSYWMKVIVDGLEGNNEKLLFGFGMFGASVIVGNLLTSLSYYLGDKVIIPMARKIREDVFQKMMELDFAYHVEKSTGSLISAFRRGDGAVFNMFHNIFHELFSISIMLLISLYLLYTVQPLMVLVMLGLVIINMGLIFWLIKKNLGTRKDFNKADDRVSGVIADSMINYETVKFFAAEKKERGRLSDKFVDWVRTLWKFSNTFRLLDVTIGTVSGVGTLGIMWLAINNKSISTGEVIMAISVVMGFYWQFFNLFFRIRDIAKSSTDLEKYLEILDKDVNVKDPARAKSAEDLKGKIEFDKVSFVYPKSKDRVLNKISLEIKEGESIAFVGRSGAGKTTLTKLLLRFYDVTEGVIRVGGVDVKEMRKSDLRSLMGVVPQEPVMFNNTVKFNLSYGKEKAKMAEIREAAAKANILDFIEKLPKKWKTEVGERGIKLSGGQKQRLAIARALLTDPKILIFDEATSNLDSESERMIQEALMEASKKRTVIVIAHRLSTIKNMDRIIVLSNGEIAETGKHEELVKEKGIYSRLWDLQSKGKLLEDKEKLI